MHKYVLPGVRAKVVAAIYGVRKGRGGSVLEWLKRAPKRHGPSSLAEVSEKIAFLKGLGADKWALEDITSARLHAYGQSVSKRAPSDTKRVLGDQHDLEIVCFLRMTLLELTDAALYMAGRRVNDLTRHAATRVEAKQARGVRHYRDRQEEMRVIVHDDETPTEKRIQSLKELLPKNEREEQYTRAALVRQSLVDDGKRVAAVLNSFVGLEVQGPASDPAMKQIAALRDLHERKLVVSLVRVRIASPRWGPAAPCPRSIARLPLVGQQLLDAAVQLRGHPARGKGVPDAARAGHQEIGTHRQRSPQGLRAAAGLTGRTMNIESYCNWSGLKDLPADVIEAARTFRRALEALTRPESLAFVEVRWSYRVPRNLERAAPAPCSISSPSGPTTWSKRSAGPPIRTGSCWLWPRPSSGTTASTAAANGSASTRPAPPSGERVLQLGIGRVRIQS